MRVCAVFSAALEDAARQFNVEFRVSDATACPYMVLGAIVHAGLDGIRKCMTLNAPLPMGMPQMTDEERRGFRAYNAAPLAGAGA